VAKEHVVKVTLNEGQWDALVMHADSKKRRPDEDLLAVWWGRMQALANYAEKLKSGSQEFRAYAPKGLPDEERSKIKALAIAKGVAPDNRQKERRREERREGREKRRAAKKATKAAPTVRSVSDPKPIRVPKPQRKEPSHPIQLYDSPGVAKAKAMNADPTGWKEALAEVNRDETGKLVKA
jgi:hypothetical protein